MERLNIEPDGTSGDSRVKHCLKVIKRAEWCFSPDRRPAGRFVVLLHAGEMVRFMHNAGKTRWPIWLTARSINPRPFPYNGIYLR